MANTYSSLVESVSVGNETMVSWSGLAVPPADMRSYINQVRAAVTQPVTTDDNWAFFANSGNVYSTDLILASVDYVAYHSYPFSDAASGTTIWDWQQTSTAAASRAASMMTAAQASAQHDYNAVKTYLSSKGYGSLPIVLGETGWKSTATNGAQVGAEYSMAHPVNQKMYVDNLNSWWSNGGASNGPKNIFYFEAFDEPWKSSDDGWGLFDAARYAKYDLYSTFPGSNEGTAYALSYSSSDAIFYIQPLNNAAAGKATYAAYSDTKVAISGGDVQVPSGSNRPLSAWYAWSNNGTNTSYSYNTSGSGASDSGSYMKIIPAPASWGWGMFLNLNNADDLSAFSGGHLHFSIKTAYSGKLEVGFVTGWPSLATNNNFWATIDPTVITYGTWAEDGSWYDLSIPIATISTHKVPGTNVTAGIDLSKVTSPFVIDDVYSGSSSTAFAGTNNTHAQTAEVDIDNIYWTTN